MSDIENLKDCIEDSKQAFLDSDPGPADSADYSQLRGRLEASRNKFPPLYRNIDVEPYINTLNDVGEQGFITILLRDPQKQGQAGLMFDIAQAILQKGEKYDEIAIDGFQEVVSDLYDGFLSAEDRRGINPPDKETIPPIVKFGNVAAGPYTWPIDATSSFGLKTGVVSLPPSHARHGLLGWAALGHETAGHDVLHADTGLLEQASTSVQTALSQQGLQDGLPEYWSSRIDETASDCLGILNMGPMAGMGIIGYFRGINDAFTGEPKLRNEGAEDDPHPADIVRGYLAASTVSLLSFKEADSWAKIIESETDKDLSKIVLDDNEIDPKIAKQSAKIVASAICNTKFQSLENHSFRDIQDWHDQDQGIVNQLMPLMTSANQIPSTLSTGLYAAHVVAAAVQSALSKADISSIFNRMLTVLKMMHDTDPSWGPLYIRHRGNATRDLISSIFSSEHRNIEVSDAKNLRYRTGSGTKK